jgi:predicted esterase
MSHRVYGVIVGVALSALAGCGEQPVEPPASSPPPVEQADHRASLRDALQALSQESGDPLLRLHFRSIIEVIDAGDRRLPSDTENISELWQAFEDASAPNSPRRRESYLNRSMQLIVSWTSPTDGQVSFTWLSLPAGWNPEREYPLYVGLHGLWDVAADRLEYLNYPFQHPGTSFAYEDGYQISPWGRGNQWYRGIAETDIWECIAMIKSLVRVDESRQYLNGHSMGGYGAWHIALNSAETWAALGIHAGALWYDQREVSAAAAATLRDVPTYFVVGNSDGLLGLNQTAYQLLRDAGNPHLAFVTFPGAHDYRQEDVERMYLWMRAFDRDDRRSVSLD